MREILVFSAGVVLAMLLLCKGVSNADLHCKEATASYWDYRFCMGF